MSKPSQNKTSVHYVLFIQNGLTRIILAAAGIARPMNFSLSVKIDRQLVCVWICQEMRRIGTGNTL